MRKCPGYIFLPGQRFEACPTCYAGRAHRPAPTMVKRTCMRCEQSDQRGWLDCVFCGGEMRQAKDMPRYCLDCKQQFKVRANNQKRCESCNRIVIANRKKEARLAAPPVKKPRQQVSKIVCATCVHGVASSAAESGYQCGIERSLTCQPFGARRLYEQR